MVQWTDCELTIKVKDADFTDATDIHVTLGQTNTTIDTMDVTVTGPHELQCAFSQEETGVLSSFEKHADIQVNWLDVNGKRKATRKKRITVEDNILKESIG